MQISGLIRFDALTKAGVQILQEYEQRRIRGVQFTFGPLPGRALMFWDSTALLHDVCHLIELVFSNPELAD